MLYIQATPILTRTFSLPAEQTLYLDTSLSDDEAITVIGAALEWQTATRGLVHYNIVKLPITKDTIDENVIIVFSVSPYFPEILSLDKESSKTHLGYYDSHGDTPYIVLVSERLTPDNYKSVILHELGHALGLKHNNGDEGMGTLMYPDIELGSKSITNTDLDNFCKLYGCNSTGLYNK
jgi:hypothetical protein